MMNESINKRKINPHFGFNFTLIPPAANPPSKAREPSFLRRQETKPLFYALGFGAVLLPNEENVILSTFNSLSLTSLSFLLFSLQRLRLVHKTKLFSFKPQGRVVYK